MEKKPGWKTTEFWLSAAVTIGGLILAALAGETISNDVAKVVVQVLSGLVSAGTAMGYGTKIATKQKQDVLEANLKKSALEKGLLPGPRVGK